MTIDFTISVDGKDMIIYKRCSLFNPVFPNHPQSITLRPTLGPKNLTRRSVNLLPVLLPPAASSSSSSVESMSRRSEELFLTYQMFKILCRFYLANRGGGTMYMNKFNILIFSHWNIHIMYEEHEMISIIIKIYKHD